MDPISSIFSRLDAWRHLPAYQLERRADVFFAAYLPEVLADFAQHAIHPIVIPELPLRRADDNASKKVDYALFAQDLSRAYFVELKTDMASRRGSQDAYLDHAARGGLREVVRGVCEIVRATKHRRKYFHLVHQLAALGLVDVPEALSAAIFADAPMKRLAAPPAAVRARSEHSRTRSDSASTPALIARPTLDSLMAQLRPTAVDLPIEIVFIQPHPDEDRRSIDFERFAAHAAARSDPFSQRFAESLRRWKTPAGHLPP